MKRILVPCDFSKPAINALRFALNIAQRSKGTIYLLNVIELPMIHDTTFMPILDFENQFLSELKEKTEQEFVKIIKKYQADGVKVFSEVKFGAVIPMIREYCIDQSIDLIVMGSHGASGIREFLIGSNAEKMVRKSTVPVIVIKDHVKHSVENIVFPNTLDIDGQDELVLKVKALQHFFKAHLHIVWINTPLNFTSDTFTRERMLSFAKRFMLKDYTINIFNSTDEEKGIQEFTDLVKGDLIAMGTHGRKGIAHLINGSVAEEVVNHTKGVIWTYSLKNEPVNA